MLVRRTSVRSLSQATSLQNKSKLYSFQVRKLWTSKVPAPRSLEGKSSHLKTYRKRDVNALVNTRHVVQQLSEGIVALRQGGWSGTETIFARTLLLQRAKALESILSTVVTPRSWIGTTCPNKWLKPRRRNSSRSRRRFATSVYTAWETCRCAA